MSNFIGFSKGLYSSWFFHSPSRSLFDCGEGCSSFLGKKVYAIENIFLSHGHFDHTAGLISLVGIRALSMGDRLKPLNIYFPEGTREIYRLHDFLLDSWGDRLPYRLNWYEVNAGAELPHKVETFQTTHTNGLTLGYKVMETRKRLRPEYEGQDIAALARAENFDRAKLMYNYESINMVYTLDSTNRIMLDDIRGADLWIADTTFLKAADRDRNSHGTLDEMLDLAIEAQVKVLRCAHFSPRYERHEIDEAMAIASVRGAKAGVTVLPVHFSGVQTF